MGIDLVQLAKFNEVLENTLSFRDRIFTRKELELSNRQLAGNFALKECFLKTYKKSRDWKYTEIKFLRDSFNAPFFLPNGNLEKEIGNLRVECSITNKSDYVIGNPDPISTYELGVD
jgi:holo-[acyl-carrier protein] synthase